MMNQIEKNPDVDDYQPFLWFERKNKKQKMLRKSDRQTENTPNKTLEEGVEAKTIFFFFVFWIFYTTLFGDTHMLNLSFIAGCVYTTVVCKKKKKKS